MVTKSETISALRADIHLAQRRISRRARRDQAVRRQLIAKREQLRQAIVEATHHRFFVRPGPLAEFVYRR
jgi:hypothetical protein